MTGYLKPMELSDDGVWRRSTAEANDDIKITDTANFYALADKDILEFDSLKVNDYIVDQNLQDPAIPTIPVGAAPDDMDKGCFGGFAKDNRECNLGHRSRTLGKG